MTNVTKAADLIGKKILVGDGKNYYIAKREDGDKVVLDFHRGDAAPMEIPMSWALMKECIDTGKFTIDGEQAQVSATADVEVAEVTDIVPQVKPRKKPEPKEEKPTAKIEPIKPDKPKKGDKPKGEKKPAEPKAKPEVKADGTLTYETYKSKKGKTCARIKGFAETDAAYQNAADLHGSASWETTKKGKVLYLSFGHCYVDAAKQVCEALNAGKSLADCKAIIDGATKERAQQRAESKQKHEERKAAAAEPKAKTYTEAEVLDLLRRVAAGDPDAMAAVNAMEAKAA